MFRAFVFSVLVAFAFASGGNLWKYGKTVAQVYGPPDWNKVSEHCSESTQSPIDISSAQNDPSLAGLSFTCDNENEAVSGTLTNNGHAPTLSIDKSKGTASLTGGPLGDSVYKLEQLHFHIGCEDNKGSEHTMNGNAYSGELHLVTFNTKYPDFAIAADKSDGLSVIGVFLQKSDDSTNVKLQNLPMQEVIKAGSSTAVNNVLLYELVPELQDLSKASFFSYKGSLTTPPCYQSVSWNVLKDPIPVDDKVLNAIRGLHDHEKHSICDNFRPTQPLNGRTVSENSA